MKYAIVTGGTKGIGEAIVKKFVEKGFHVITCARNKEALNALHKRIGEQVSTFQADLSNKDEVIEFVGFIHSITANVHVLVNNAGTFLPGEIMQEKDENFEMQMDLNLKSVYYLTKNLNVNLVDKESYIANICSTASFMAYANGGSYSISKFALLGFTKVLREELKTRAIAVSAVMPGATFTSSWEGTDLPQERFMRSEDVANAVWLGYESRKTAVMEEIVLRPVLGDL